MLVAAIWGHKEVAEWLLSLGASVTDKDEVYCSYSACRGGIYFLFRGFIIFVSTLLFTYFTE